MDLTTQEHFRHPQFSPLHIFQRDSGKYFAGFHHKGRYVRKATGFSNPATALKAAEEWYQDRIAEQRLGLFKPTLRNTLKDAAQLALKKLEAKVERGDRSKRYSNGIKLLLESDLLPFFGSFDVKDIGPAKWNAYETHILSLKPGLTRKTLYQHRNALRLCLNEALQREWIDRLPPIKVDKATTKDVLPRCWFERSELRTLLRIAKLHIDTHKKTRWAGDAAECYDFIIWLLNTGMRVGEARNVRFCDVEVCTEQVKPGRNRLYCLIKNIEGKRGTGECRSWYGAYRALQRIIERRQIADPQNSTEKLFLAHHLDMFNEILREANLKFTSTDPPRRRDFVSLRHTYITLGLIRGVPIFDIATNCRTSVLMIQNHYARFVSPRYLKSLNKGGANE